MDDGVRTAVEDCRFESLVRLAVGTGWLRVEVEACGAPFHARGRRPDEQLQVLRALWADRPVR